MSKLDRLWLSVTWCDTWPNCIQTVLQRGLSDHVLISINNNRRICVLDNKITEMKNQISSLDTKGEEFALLDDEKARMTWLQEGDANSKFFHSVMSNRWHHNAIQLVYVDDVKVEGAVWDCDSYKSLGPDGIRFGFIKQFWQELKDYFMRFLS
ncbi:hypothetical protein MTR_3g051000 [Medicago truncatula]|uniref:Endonuclease/exonuclease/phosphatase family protein n=1 Tax=Medicago truncatula TaxID=3880 RepID=G7J205_MEDTR|nr:hypothetical protein MTR_3g051000 [Medicago truncatula]